MSHTYMISSVWLISLSMIISRSIHVTGVLPNTSSVHVPNVQWDETTKTSEFGAKKGLLQGQAGRTGGSCSKLPNSPVTNSLTCLAAIPQRCLISPKLTTFKSFRNSLIPQWSTYWVLGAGDMKGQKGQRSLLWWNLHSLEETKSKWNKMQNI